MADPAEAAALAELERFVTGYQAPVLAAARPAAAAAAAGPEAGL
jgi:hypothetical protein